WSRVHVEQAWSDPKFGRLETGGSSTVRRKFTPMRKAGAAARGMLVAAAAETWGGGPAGCRAGNGRGLPPATEGRPDYGALAAAAATMDVPQDPPLKDPKEFRLIGKTMPRTDTPLKVDGSAVYGIDVKLPGMLYATVARCPVFGGKVGRYDA